MKAILPKSFAAVLLLFWSVSSYGQQPVSFTSSLERLTNLSAWPQFTEGTLVKQISSYDTTGGNNDGFGGNYSYIRKEAGGLVIFDEKGQGVIERIWTPTPTDDTLDFYFDGSISPALSIKFRDLFNNTVFPFLKPLADHKVGGFYSYVPIPYKQGCKIVFRGPKILFHQIQYRTYDQRYRVETFRNRFTKNEEALLNRTAALWSNENRDIQQWYPVDPETVSHELLLKPGAVAKLADLRQGGRIVGIELMPAAAFSGLHKQIDLKITWDNEAFPAVYMPVADFFGFAYGARSMESLFLGATPVKAYSYLPMPFDQRATIELVYREGAAAVPVALTAKVFYTRQKRDVVKEGRFYAFWKNEQPQQGSPYVFLEGRGKGHYIGTLLQGQATDATHFTEFFEGDDRTEIDGVMTAHGTGSEDYFNGGWYAQPGGWVERLGAPLSGCLDYTLPLGRTGGYRFFLSDKMPFYKEIRHTIEHGPENNNRAVQYISVALYYAERPVAPVTVPVNALTTVFIPDTVTFYTRLMQQLTYNGNLELKEGVAVLQGSSNASLNINVSEIPKGTYRVFLHAVEATAGKLEVCLSGAAGGRNWQQVLLSAAPGDLELGRVTITDGSIPVNLLFRSGEPHPDLKFDRVLLVKEPAH
ncbi:glycoside hydrolase family 172 protein [Niabella beijingensis]|uniref:glycoside hydrolase family 172 protein n=1 Tax=Niabella beijingensis TaxID=2872700 RepID=UPI001CBE75E5|nr:glycoside hydrolase family 172 protein [Niabella beijingensis]MBZ4187347.1 DUF2961 domain-containing protein [Niabella beijingensis]